jgi:hypothetical protein
VPAPPATSRSEAEDLLRVEDEDRVPRGVHDREHRDGSEKQPKGGVPGHEADAFDDVRAQRRSQPLGTEPSAHRRHEERRHGERTCVDEERKGHSNAEQKAADRRAHKLIGDARAGPEAAVRLLKPVLRNKRREDRAGGVGEQRLR